MDGYPNESDHIHELAAWAPEKPEEQQKEEDKERQKVISSIGVIQDVLDWFDGKTADYLNPMVISGITPETKAANVKAAVLHAQDMSREFATKRAQFVADFGKYLETKEEDKQT